VNLGKQQEAGQEFGQGKREEIDATTRRRKSKLREDALRKQSGTPLNPQSKKLIASSSKKDVDLHDKGALSKVINRKRGE